MNYTQLLFTSIAWALWPLEVSSTGLLKPLYLCHCQQVSQLQPRLQCGQ